MAEQASAQHAVHAEHAKVQARLEADVAALKASLQHAQQELAAAQRRAQLQEVKLSDAVADKEVCSGMARCALRCTVGERFERAAPCALHINGDAARAGLVLETCRVTALRQRQRAAEHMQRSMCSVEAGRKERTAMAATTRELQQNAAKLSTRCSALEHDLQVRSATCGRLQTRAMHSHLVSAGEPHLSLRTAQLTTRKPWS